MMQPRRFDRRSGVGGKAETPEISVVIPVFNEVENLDPLIRELASVLDGLGRRWEALLVDDGSTDGSRGEIGRIAASDRRIRGIHFSSNSGQTAAFHAGFDRARGGLILTMDADLQNDPSDIPCLLDRLDRPSHCDAVVGWRQHRQDTPVRLISSRIANTVRNIVSGDRVRDTGCSLKVFRTECLRRLKLYEGMHRFLPTLLRLEGFLVEEIPVGHRPRRAGRSKYGIGNRAMRALMDLLAVRWMRRRRLDYSIEEETGIENAK
jgi:glycosyltransferase involved in cell wall biosynthesis